MNIFFVTYGDKYFEYSKIRICKEAKKFGFDKVIEFSPADLTTDFINKTTPIIQERKGGGCYLWKPFILNKVFNIMNIDDIVVYLDAGCTINIAGKYRFNEYIKFMDLNKGVFSFHLPGKKEANYTSILDEWCKKNDLQINQGYLQYILNRDQTYTLNEAYIKKVLDEAEQDKEGRSQDTEDNHQDKIYKEE